MNKEIVQRFLIEYNGEYEVGALNNDFKNLDENCHFVLNDIYFPIPPLNITVQKENFNFNYKTLRTKASTKIASGRGIINIQLKLLFNAEMFLMLHRLIIQVQNNPFVYLRSNYIYESIFGTKLEYNQRNLHCTVIGLRVSSFQAANNTFEVELDLRYFNYFPYSPNLLFKKDYENPLSVNGTKITSAIFSVFPKKVTDQVLEYDLKYIDYEISKKVDTAQDKKVLSQVSVQDTIDIITNKVKFTFNSASYTPVQSAVFVRYYNYLQTKALYEDFGIAVGFDGGKHFLSISLPNNIKDGLETGFFDKGNMRFVIGLHSKYMPYETRKQIIKSMLEKEFNTKIYYNEYAYLQLKESVLKKYRQEMMHGTEGIEDEIQRNAKIKENQTKIANWLSSEVSENKDFKYAASYVAKEEIVNRNQIVPLPKINSNERDIKYIVASDDFQINKRENISFNQFLFENISAYYPITNQGYIKNNIKNRIYNQQIGSTDKASYGLFPVFSPFNNASILEYDNLNRILYFGNSETTLKIEPVTMLTDESGSLVLQNELINKGDLLGFCEKEYFTITVEAGNYDVFLSASESNEPLNTPVLSNSSGISELSTQKAYGLNVITEEDRDSFREFNEYLRKASWFPYIDKEYISNIFYKTRVLKIENSSFEITKKAATGDSLFGAFDVSEMKSEALINVAAGINNLTASIPIIGQDYPTTQFLSSTEPSYNFNYIVRTRTNSSDRELSGLPETILEFERIRSVLAKNAREYKFIPDAGFFLIDSLMTRLFGTFKEKYIVSDNTVNYSSVRILKPLVIDSFENRTLDSFPGASSFTMRLSETAVYNPEEIKEVVTNKTNDNNKFLENLYQKVKENYCGENGEVILSSTTVVPSKPAVAKAIGAYKPFEWNSKYFSYKDHYKNENLEECKKFLENLPGIDYLAYLCYTEFLDKIVDFYKFVCSKTNTSEPKIVVTSGYDNPSKPGTRTTISDHYFGSAMDIKAIGRNAQELHLIVELMYRLGIVDNPTAPGVKGDNIGGLGIYGRDILTGVVMGDKPGGFVHIDLNVKKGDNDFIEQLKNLPNNQKRNAVVEAFLSGKLFGSSIDPKTYRLAKTRRFSGYTDDKILGIINPTPQAQYWGSTSHLNYKNEEFDNFSIDLSGTRESVFTDLLLLFQSQTDKPTEADTNDQIDEEDDTDSQKNELKKRLDLELKKSPNRDQNLLNPDAGINIFKEDWESILESKFKGTVWTSDFKFGSDILNASLYTENETYEKNLKSNLARKLFNESNGTITNDTLVKRFSIEAVTTKINFPADSSIPDRGESYSNIYDIEAYLKEQGLTFTITDTSGNLIDLNSFQTNKKISEFQIFVVDPSAGMKTDHISEKYVKGELATLIDMICSFDKFASFLLIEPDMYLEENNPASIKTEYDRIQKELFGVEVACSYFSNLEFGSFGILKYTQKKSDSWKRIEDILNEYKNENSFLTKQLGTDTSYSRITDTLVSVGFFLYEVVAAVLIVKAAIGLAPITGGTSIFAGIVAGLSIIGGSHFIVNEIESVTNNTSSSVKLPNHLSNSLSNIFRALHYLIEDFSKRTINYKDSQIWNDIADRQFDIFKKVYGAISLKNNIDFAGKTREKILFNTEGADTIVQACRDIHEVYMERNPIILKFLDAAANIRTNSQLESLIRSDFIEGNTTVKRFSFLARDFDAGLGVDYLTHLFYFPKAEEFKLFYDFTSFNEVDFVDLFEWKTEEGTSGVVYSDTDYKWDRGSDNQKFYSIDEQLNRLAATNKKTGNELFDFSQSQIEQDQIGNNRWIYKNRKKLREEQDKRIAYLKRVLQETLKSLFSFPEFRETLNNSVAGFDEEFDFSGSNAYPDIDLPLDPFNPELNTNMNPGFFYYESEYENNLDLVKQKVEKRATGILENSLSFVKELRNGLFVGNKNVLESQDNNIIKDFVIKDQQDGSNDIGHILEGNTSSPKNILKDTNIYPENKIPSEKELETISISNNTDQEANESFDKGKGFSNAQDNLSGELILNESLNNLNKVQDPAAHLNKMKDDLKKSMQGTMQAFGSTLGFNRENLQTLKLFQQATSDSNLNNYLGLLGDNSNYLEDNNIKEVLRKSGENLLKKQYDMKKAYPTFKFYLIEEDAVNSDNLFVFDDFYSFNSVKDFTIHKSRKLAADTAVIRLQNISGTLDGSKIGLLRDIDYDINQTREISTIGQEPAYEKIDSVVLRPGVSCQLRAGYNSNPKDLTILLSGKIADVAWSSNGDMCEITVQSFGVELETRRYGMSKEDPISQINFNTTHKLLSYLLFRPELKHFGRFKKNRRFQIGESKSVVIAKENYLGNTQGLSFAQSVLEYAGSLTFAFIVVAVIGSIYKVRQLRAIGNSPAALKVVDDAAAAGKNATAEVFGEASKAAGTLNVARQAAVTEQIIQSSGFFGKIMDGIFKRGWGRGTRLADDALDEVARKARGSSLSGDDLLIHADKYVGAATANSRVVNAILNTINYFTGIVFNVSKGGKFIDVLDNVGDTSSLLRKLTTMNASVTATTARAFAQKSWIGAYFGAVTNGLTLGIWSSVKFQATAFLLGKTAEWLLNGLVAIKDGVFESLKALILDTFNPSLDQIILSPQDDSLYCPHPDKYIKPKKYKGFFSSIINGIVDVAGKLFTIVYNTALSGFIDPNAVGQENLLKVKSLMMDRRLSAANGENVYNISGNTIWEMFHEMSLRHPGWVYGARQYGTGLEYKMFFGLPSQRYFAHPISPSKAIRLNQIWEIAQSDSADLITLESLIGSKKFNSIKEKFAGNEKQDSIVSEYCKTILFEEWTRTTNKRFVPFRNYHLLSSTYNIVANNISGMNDIINEVGVMYNEAGVTEEPKWVIRTVRAHENIPEEQIHSKPIRYANLKGNAAALRYGIGELANSAKEMYRGEIITLGNPDINPYDVCILDDKCNEMFGPIEVEAVTHMFNFETGFLTEIKPNALVTANEGITFPMLNSVIMYDIGMDIAQKEHHSLRYNSEKFDEVISDRIDDWLDNIDLFEFPILDKVTINTDIATKIEQLRSGVNEADDAKKALLKQQIKDMFLNGNAIFQSEILNSNASVNGIIDTSGLTGLLGAVPAGATVLQLIQNASTGARSFSNLKNPTVMFFTALAALSYSAKNVLNYQLSTPGTFIANKLLPGDMLVSPVTDGNLVQIYPLFKNNKPMVYGGYDKLSLKNNISNKLGNIYNTMSDAAFSINSMILEYSNTNSILNDQTQISTLKEVSLKGLQSLLPFNLPNDTLKYYHTSYKDADLNTAITNTTNQ